VSYPVIPVNHKLRDGGFLDDGIQRRFVLCKYLLAICKVIKVCSELFLNCSQLLVSRIQLLNLLIKVLFCLLALGDILPLRDG
jgi:hypothetical protein